MRRARHLMLALLAGATMAQFTAPPALAAPTPVDPAQHRQMLDIWKKMISIPTVHGRGQMAAMANYVAELLKQGGFAAEDVRIEGSGDDLSLAARYRGTGKGKPILLSGHMDVVEARASDWTRDPFVPVEENGYVYGRGALDMKFGDALLVSTLLKLKAEGFRPSRDIILMLSGDEETAMATTARLAEQYGGNAELLLNADGGGGLLDKQGKPVAFYVQGGEKTYADIEISVTNPGGHSSRPGATNAIADLARAIDRVAAYRFPAQTNEITRAFFRATGKQVGGATGEAMLRFADNPDDAAALATLRADPEYVGITGTTCVPTMLNGGHALNALPQKATVSVNCRIFPGVSVENVRDTLAKVIENPSATVTILDHPLASDASPLRPDLMEAVRKGIDQSFPGLPIVPQMSAGATDSLYFRAKGVPSYGVLGMFIKPEDDFSHGLNERAPVASIDPALRLMKTLIVELSK